MTSPQDKQDNDVTTDKRGNDVTADKQDNDVTADKRGNDVTADKQDNDVTADKRGNDVTADKQGNDVTADKHGNDVTADKHGNDVTADKHGKDLTTDKRLGKQMKKKTNCNICGKVFHANWSLKRHLLYSHGGIWEHGRQFVCPICSKAYKYSDSLQHHYKTSYNSSLTVSMMPSISRRVSCGSPKATVTVVGTDASLRAAAGIGGDLTAANQSKQSSAVIQPAKNAPNHQIVAKKERGKKILECPICHKMYANAQSLRVHTESLHTEKHSGVMYKCPSCDRTYKYIISMKAHHWKAHNVRIYGSEWPSIPAPQPSDKQPDIRNQAALSNNTLPSNPAVPSNHVVSQKTSEDDHDDYDDGDSPDNDDNDSSWQTSEE